MNKEIKPLEALERLEVTFNLLIESNEFVNRDISIIKNALKAYQELLERPCVLMGRTTGRTKALIDMISKNYKEIKITNLDDEKKVKALGIINSKNVQVSYLKDCETLDDYNSIWGDNGFESRKLTSEQYDLLKEVLL